jgi:hypothetical protein
VQVSWSLHETQFLGQLTQIEFTKTLPLPQPTKQAPLLRVIPVGQEVQPFGPFCEQVTQEASQGRQAF